MAGPRDGSAQPYDFRRPNKFSRDHVRALQMVCETFSRHLSTLLATTLRSMTNVSLRSVEQLTYDEYVGGLPNPSYLAILALHPLPGAAMFQFPLSIAMTAVDRMLGGTGPITHLDRSLTEIESNLMRSLTERALRELSYAFESLVRLEPEIVQQEANPQFAQIAAPSDMTVVLTFDIRINDERAATTLCIPFDSLQPVLDTFASQSLFSDRADEAVEAFGHQLQDALRSTSVEVNVRFNEVTLTSAEVVNLAVGDIIPLRHGLEEPLTVSVGSTACYRAITGRKGRRLACLIVSSERDELA
ncbi:MAG: flagellar motor switch protein FliM [Acidimicrobiia bacterium]